MKTLDIPVNARDGATAQDVLRSLLKRDLRPGGHLATLGFAEYGIGISEEIAKRPFGSVAAQEDVSDPQVLRTFLIHTILYKTSEVTK